MLKLKSKRATDKEFSHTEVYFGKEFLGYFIPNRSKFAVKNENWNFISKCIRVQSFYSRTKNELLATLEKQVNNEYVKLNQHFGIVTELN